MTSRNQQGRGTPSVLRPNSQPIRPARMGGTSRRSSGSFSNSPSNPNSSQQYSRNSSQYSMASQKRMSKTKKIAIGALCTFLLVLIGGGTAFALYVNSINEALSGGKTEEEKQAIADTLAPVHNYDDPFYMLLIGSDKRIGNDEEGQRSDTNILVRVDPVNCVITMVSIPRDTKIELEGYGTNKFNAAYNYGGAAATIKEASELCGVEISHYAEVNFVELTMLVDIIGCVEVDVPETIDDPQAGSMVIEEGTQTLNGEMALAFARSRAYADGDFTRTSNQRILIEAIISKVMSLPITEIPGVIQAGAECVTTDFTVQQLIDLALQFKDIGKLTMYSAMVPSTTADIGGISYVITDTKALTEMMQIVEAGGDPSTVELSGEVYESSSSSSSDTSTYGYDSTEEYYYDPSYDAGSGYSDDSGSYYPEDTGGTGEDYIDPGPIGGGSTEEGVSG